MQNISPEMQNFQGFFPVMSDCGMPRESEPFSAQLPYNIPFTCPPGDYGLGHGEVVQNSTSLSPCTSSPSQPMEGLQGESSLSPTFAEQMSDPWRQNETQELQIVTNSKMRRRIQNRAAQRAFRERKEHHIKELEKKLTSAEDVRDQLKTDNEQLKAALLQTKNENHVLRAGLQRLMSEKASKSESLSPPLKTPVVFAGDERKEL